MRRVFACLCLVVFGLVSGSVFAQAPGSRTPRHAIPMNLSLYPSANPTPQHRSYNKLSAEANAEIAQAGLQSGPGGSASSSAVDPIVSVPHWSSSFTFNSTVYPYTMMGRAPSKGDTTTVGTQYVPISFSFDEFIDQNGNNIVIDATSITNEIKESPNFENSSYANGFTQFGDAVQRAEFYNLIKGQPSGEEGWHTVLKEPETLTPVTIEVPFGSSLVFTDGTNIWAFIDINFIVSQLNTLIQLENMKLDSIPIYLTHNVVYADFFFGGCCIGGFHTAFETGHKGNNHFVQVFDFATSLDAAVANDIFGDPTVFADVDALSHELSETMNDPFVNNVVPPWEFPPPVLPGNCSNILETGDPVANLPNRSFPVTLHGFTYNPQTEALLQWFTRISPSNAFNGMYSFPGNNLTSPSTSAGCP
jgi:hypothetical protein